MATLRSQPGLLTSSASFAVWLIYFVVVYLIVEFGCPLGLARASVWGANAVQVLLLVISVPVLIVIGLLGLRGYRSWRAQEKMPRDSASDDQLFFPFITLTGALLAFIATVWVVFPVLVLPPCD